MTLDPLSGVEIELVLESMDRLELASAIAAKLGVRVESGTTISKVPVPQLRGRMPDREVPAATIAALKAIAERHQARILKVAANGRHFYLEHRAARLVDSDGLLCRFVHDNTLEGGERVCELVSAPLHGEALRQRMGAVLEALRSVARYHFTKATALHVHIEHAVLRTPAQLARLIAQFANEEADLRARLRCPSGLQRAKPLPAAVLAWRPTTDSWEETRAALHPHIPERDHALNLYNLVTNDPDKPTIELKIAASTDAIDAVMAARAIFVELIASATL